MISFNLPKLSPHSVDDINCSNIIPNCKRPAAFIFTISILTRTHLMITHKIRFLIGFYTNFMEFIYLISFEIILLLKLRLFFNVRAFFIEFSQFHFLLDF